MSEALPSGDPMEPARTVPELLRRRATSAPEAVAVLGAGGEARTYAELRSTVEAMSSVLAAGGLGPGDLVAVALPDEVATAEVLLAVAAVATCLPLDPAAPEAECERLLGRLHPALVIAASGAPASRAAEALGLPVGGPGGPAEPLRFTTATASARPPGARSRAVAAEDTAFLLATSGSSTAPKLVPLTHRNVLAAARNVVASLELGPADRALSALPLFHVGGIVDLLLAPMHAGGSVAYARDRGPAAFFDALAAARPTWHQAVPTMLRALVDHARLSDTPAGAIPTGAAPTDGAGLRFVRSVSAPLPPDLMREVEALLGVPVIEIYGMTETAGVITSNRLPPAARRVGSVGVSAGPEVAVLDAFGNPVLAGEEGELVVRGPSVMTGYFGASEGSRDDFIGSWLRTGDLGMLDADGHLFLRGRIKDVINRGGEMVAPAEVDAALRALSGVADAAAFSVPHFTLGEEVAAAVVADPGATLDEAGALRALRERLSAHKVPRRLHRVDALPTGPGGKLSRQALTQRFGGAEEPALRSHDEPGSRARVLIELFEEVLDVQGVSPAHDFFDLGGDSLSAATLVARLEERTGRRIDVATLLDAPTAEALEALLLRAAGEVASEAPAEPHATGHAADDPADDPPDHGRADGSPRDAREPLPSRVREWIAVHVAGWTGARATERSFLVGYNTLGTRPPLFWCGQVANEINQLHRYLDPNQPLYGMRSLYRLRGKDAAANRALADRYAGEILELRPDGPYRLGGFCEGAKVAFEIAKRLRSAGRQVDLLCLQEQFVPEPYDGPLALFFGRPGVLSPYTYFGRPETGWAKYYTGPVTLRRSDIPHDDFYHEPYAPDFVTQLSDVLRAATDGTVARDLEPWSGGAVLAPGSYRATVRVTMPRVLAPAARARVRVRLANHGTEPWEATRRSGLLVRNRWQELTGRTRVWLDGAAPLATRLAPGESMDVELDITAPGRAGPWRLEVDLVDEGVTWFQDRGSQPARRALVVAGPARERERPPRPGTDRRGAA